MTPEPPTLQPWQYQPSRDHGLPPQERARSLQRESGLVATALHQLWWANVRLYLRVAHRLRVIGQEHLPRKAPFVMIANHASHLDVLVLAARLPVRLRDHIFPVAAGDVFFERPAVSLFASLCLNALPIWRKRNCSHALADLRHRMLQEPAGYLLFPEGKRSRDGSMDRFKPGLGMLVAGADVPVIPCHIRGAFEAAPPGSRIPRWRGITLRVGQPLNFGQTANDRAGWDSVAQTARQAVQALSETP